ncbi:MAG TPA: dipeptide epimerase [Rhodanobacteraceae bacterium]|nr:dipeptide epimerase [Rhodanobacteraceae bacterium]
MKALRMHVAVEKLRLAKPFRISGYVFETQDAIVVTLDDGRHRGLGEASGVYYLGDTAETMVAAVEAARDAIEGGINRTALQRLMPPGGARNAVDCALWDLEAQRTGRDVWALAGLASVKPLVTTFTIGADDPAVMADGASAYANARALKMKLTGDLDADIARVKAVRAARPDTWLGVDANQGYAIDAIDALMPVLVEANVALLEQPIRRGREADLDGYRSPIAIAADESALSLTDIPAVARRFSVVNIKLDKCGGLTEALAMAHEARQLGLGVMVGNMVGSSLAMAPAFVVGQLCDIVDLDGPVFLAADREPGLVYEDGKVWCPGNVWGSRQAAAA